MCFNYQSINAFIFNLWGKKENQCEVLAFCYKRPTVKLVMNQKGKFNMFEYTILNNRFRIKKYEIIRRYTILTLI